VCLPVEYLSGNSLAERPHPILKESVALNYIRQVGKALTIVHEQGLVHRDIRPSNIFLRIEGAQVNAVLAGFGLAVDCDTALTRTRANELVDGFSPYELYGHNRPVGAYTDVYSLAATLYELLTGIAPASALERKNSGDMRVLAQVKNPEITGSTAKALEAGMAIAAKERPQSVADWLQMLETESTAASTPTKPDSATNAAPNAAPKSIDWTKWSVIVALIVGLAPVLTWLVDKIDTDSEQQKVAPTTEAPLAPNSETQTPPSPSAAP